MKTNSREVFVAMKDAFDSQKQVVSQAGGAVPQAKSTRTVEQEEIQSLRAELKTLRGAYIAAYLIARNVYRSVAQFDYSNGS